MTEDRLKEILNECFSYLVELKSTDSYEDKEIFVKNILGLNDSEIKLFGLDIDFLK